MKNAATNNTAILRAKAIYAAHEKNFAAEISQFPISTKEGKALRAYAGIPICELTADMIADIIAR
jgi:hypothetical protein